DPYYSGSRDRDSDDVVNYAFSYGGASNSFDTCTSSGELGDGSGYTANRYYSGKSGGIPYFSSMLLGIRDMVTLGILPNDLGDGYVTVSGVTTRNPGGGRMLDYISHLLTIMDLTGTAEQVGDGFYIE
ncbi:MAG: hypothetical protein QF415_05290, partial [Candidatus Undinarchaeales archaeon]|nr:hypothetical protein [Candidatus Undinarchaeales archaeon]